MPEISLLVTQPVIDHTTPGRQNERQIAYRSATQDIVLALNQLSASNRANLLLGCCVTVIIGDRGAIWRSHNAQHVQDFDSLYELLSRRPGSEMRFLCEII